jgi:hypothetical protein
MSLNHGQMLMTKFCVFCKTKDVPSTPLPPPQACFNEKIFIHAQGAARIQWISALFLEAEVSREYSVHGELQHSIESKWPDVLRCTFQNILCAQFYLALCVSSGKIRSPNGGVFLDIMAQVGNQH